MLCVGYNIGCILYITCKQNERYIAFILLIIEIGDSGFRIKQKTLPLYCSVFSQTITLQR